MVVPGRILATPRRQRDPCVRQDCVPLAGNAGIGVAGCADHAANARCHQCICTRRGLSVMRAGFERDVSCRSACVFLRLGKGNRFRMRAPTGGRRPASDDDLVFHDDAPDSGIWPDAALIAAAKRQCQSHPALVSRITGHGQSSAILAGRSSDTNSSKSSAA